MKNSTAFTSASESRLDEQITKTMNREFELPPSVQQAKKAAFDKIKTRELQTSRRRIRPWRPAFAGLAAAAAVFSVVCISNPAFAENIPLIGHVFENLGNKLGFSGNYQEYATVLPAESEGTASSDSAYSQTSDGVTVSLSEVYCNDEALYLSMIISSEEPFPDTMIMEADGQRYISLHMYASKMNFDFNKDSDFFLDSVSGEFTDDHTFAGVARFDLAQTEFDEKAYQTAMEEAGQSTDSVSDIDAFRTIQVPDKFTVDLSLSQIVGYLAKPLDRPEMPQDLTDEYEKGLSENGLDSSRIMEVDYYEALTDEQKEIERQLYSAMWNQYDKRYPEAAGYPSKYDNWWLDGDWSFSIPVTKNTSDTMVKEIQNVNEQGEGILSVTKTPFEITVKDSDPEIKYFTVALDADGDILPYGGTMNSLTNTFAIQNRDVSKIDVYMCDYDEYMDELKGYYWSEDYEENKKTKTFKELLDERAIFHSEVAFEE